MDLENRTSSFIRYRPPAASNAVVAITETEYHELIRLHEGIGHCVRGMARLANGAEEAARESTDPDLPLPRIWRALSAGVPSSTFTLPKRERDIGIERDTEGNLVWGAQIIFDQHRRPIVIGLDAHSCHRHAGMIAHTAKGRGMGSTLTTIIPTLDAFAEWNRSPRRRIELRSSPDETSAPIDPALVNAFSAYGLLNRPPDNPEADLTAAFHLPLRLRYKPYDLDARMRFDHSKLTTFVQPHWPVSSLNALAFLSSDDVTTHTEIANTIAACDREALQRVRGSIARTTLIDKRTFADPRALDPNKRYVLREALPLSLQRVIRCVDPVKTGRSLGEKRPFAFVLQEAIDPLTAEHRSKPYPFEIFTIARNTEFLGAVAVARIPPNGDPSAQFIFFDVRVE
jgi:hypothetical protein